MIEQRTISLENWKEHVRTDRFYHVTWREHLPSIKENGLSPISQLQNKPELTHGGEPDFVYLWNPAFGLKMIDAVIRSPENIMAMLEVELPEGYHIERDYHSGTNSLDRGDSREEIEDFFEFCGIEFTGPITEENLRRDVDLAPNWIGAYRTPEVIPPEYIDFDKWAFLNDPPYY
jgi:hypothetical protein